MAELKSGLYVPGNGGLRVGAKPRLNSMYGPAELFTMDWTPSLGNDLDDPNYPATYVWELESLSAGDYPETRVGGGTYDLEEQGGGGSLTEQSATGVFNSDGSVRKCLETTLSTAKESRFQAATNCLDVSQGSIAIRFRYRQPYESYSGNGEIILGNRQTAAGGWYVLQRDTGNVITFYVQETSGTLVQANVGTSAELNDGAWHEVEIVVDWTLDEIRIRLDGIIKVAGADLSPLTMANCSGGTFSVGGSPGFGCAAHVQIERVLGWEASDGAENIDSTAWSDVSKLGAAPAGINSTYDTLPSYSGKASVPCDAGSDGLWYLASGDKATDDYPIGYSSLLVTRGAPNGFGITTYSSWTNLITRSEQIENAAWSTGTATVSAAAADLIDNKLGFRMARKVTATTTNDFIGFPVTLTANAWHHVYAYIAGNGGTVTGRVVLYDATGADEQDSQTFSVSDGVLSLVGKRMRADATNTAHEVRIEIDNNTEAINVCHVVCAAEVSGETTFWQSGVPIPTFGATASLPTLYGISSAIASSDWLEDSGSLQLACIATSFKNTADIYVMSWSDSSATATYTSNRLAFTGWTATDFRIVQRDGNASSGGAETIATISDSIDPTTGVWVRHEWSSSGPVNGSNHIRARVTHAGGESDQGAVTSPWDTSGDEVTFAIAGRTPGSTSRATALIGYLKVWRGPGAFD